MTSDKKKMLSDNFLDFGFHHYVYTPKVPCSSRDMLTANIIIAASGPGQSPYSKRVWFSYGVGALYHIPNTSK
ncbi:MAG: hypothetical protein OXC62_12270 [Aestuariivita sp.]|nr:hypothetical protein [Aestuariivita sp.]